MANRLFLSLLFIVCAFASNAQTKNLSEFVGLVKEGSQTHFSFSQSNMKTSPMVGWVIISGNSFRMEMESGITLINNGETEWYINSDKSEIVIYKFDKNSVDISRNPFAFLDVAQEFYSVKTYGELTKKVPRKVTLTAKNGVTYTIDILGFKQLTPSEDTFYLNENLYPDAIITDLR